MNSHISVNTSTYYLVYLYIEINGQTQNSRIKRITTKKENGLPSHTLYSVFVCLCMTAFALKLECLFVCLWIHSERTVDRIVFVFSLKIPKHTYKQLLYTIQYCPLSSDTLRWFFLAPFFFYNMNGLYAFFFPSLSSSLIEFCALLHIGMSIFLNMKLSFLFDWNLVNKISL